MTIQQHSLAGRNALVTGASSGIGEAVARSLAAAGAAVGVNYHSGSDAADKIVADIEAAGGRAIALHADMASQEQIEAMFVQLDEAFGGIDILVNNAGIENQGLIVDLKLEDWDKVLAVNLRGPFLCSQQAARRMTASGGGSIVNMSSVHEVIPWAGYAHYCAAKGGLEMLMKTMALELAEQNVRVNNVAPGAIDTPINRSWIDDPEPSRKVLEKIPARRIGSAEEVAGAVLYLVSEQARYVTGTTLFIDGGMCLYASFLEQG